MSEQPLTQDTSDTRILWLLRWWLPELFASCLAVLAFISLVVLAKEYDHCGIEAMDTPESSLDLPPTMNPRPDANFGITFLAKVALLNYLKTIFDGGIEINTASQESSHTIAAMWPATRSIDAWIENLGVSMTNVVRTTTPKPDEYYNGTAYQAAYRVRWIWITLPGILLPVSQLVLIGAMLQTKRSSLRAWKGSPLALVFVSAENN